MRRLAAAAIILIGLMPPAMAGYEEGVAAWEAYDFATAYRELMPLAERGDSAAQFYVGHMYYHGSGLPQDYGQALDWFRRSAGQGDVDAQGYVGDLYYQGRGVPQNYAEAAHWYRRAAELGNSYGKLSLALLYAAGQGVPRDLAEAARLFRELAEAGDADGQRELGLAYEYGEGVPQSHEEALAWYRKAADQRDPHAFIELARLYEQGIGVQRDLLQSYAWWSLAAAALPPGEELDAVVDRRDMIGMQLTPSRLGKAQRMAAGWRPGTLMNRLDGSGGRGGAAMNAKGDAQGEPTADATLEIESSGSGFLITAGGDVVTAQHVVEDCAEIRAVRHGGQGEPATLLAADVENDLALVRLAKGGDQVASFREGRAIRPGEDIMVVGYPLSGILASESGVASGIVSAMAGLDSDTRFLQITAPVQSGNSGGPLIDMSGNVVGIVTSKLDALNIAMATGDVPQNVNFAVKQALAETFLEANGIAFARAASGAVDPGDLAERARRFTVLLECWN
jgi:TPR repeat protein/S1-C subfamily serine protease